MFDLCRIGLRRGWSILEYSIRYLFSVDEIIGRTVVIHSDPDDFSTQPAGNAGRKIACGVIRRG